MWDLEGQKLLIHVGEKFLLVGGLVGEQRVGEVQKFWIQVGEKLLLVGAGGVGGGRFLSRGADLFFMCGFFQWGDGYLFL